MCNPGWRNQRDSREGAGVLSPREQLIADLRDQIDSGRLAPGTRLPTEGNLAEQYGIVRGTVRSALGELAYTGAVESTPRHGWYVQKDERRDYPLTRIDLLRETSGRDVWMSWTGAEGLNGDARLTVTRGPAPKHVREHLDIDHDTECCIRQRVRMVNGECWMLSTGYFPRHLVRGSELDREGEGDEVDLQDPSPLGVLAKLGHSPVRDTDRIGARAGNPDENAQLHLPRGIPVMTLCRTSINADGMAVRCTADVIAAHRLYLVTEHYR